MESRRSVGLEHYTHGVAYQTGSWIQNKTRLLIMVPMLLLLLPQMASANTLIKNGDICSPAGATFKQGSANFICKKSGKKVVWQAEAKAKASATSDTTFIMPKVVGMNLQLAQDLLQSMGSYLMDQTDYKKLNRWQVIDSNWKVCAQSPSAGKKSSLLTLVTLASVKLTENC